MTHLEKLQFLAEELQKDNHETIERIANATKNCSHQDASNVWLFRKLAEMEIRLRELEALVNP
jgi:hypothetical protein